MPVELKPLKSLKHERGKHQRYRKRTPTGSGNRIVAPPAPDICPVDITGRYQTRFQDGDVEAWPMNLQVNQAGSHIEFQLVPALSSSQSDKRMKMMLFGGGDYDHGKAFFNVYLYTSKDGGTDHEGYEPAIEKRSPSAGRIELTSSDDIVLRLNDPKLAKGLGQASLFGRFDDRPTPFTQSLPGLVRRLRHARPDEKTALACGALWWPLLPYQKAYLDQAIPQIKANIRAIFETEDILQMADRVFNLEKRLILAVHPRGDWKWHPLDVPLCRLYLRRTFTKEKMKIGSESKPVLAFMDEAVKRYLAMASGASAQTYLHPIDRFRIELLRSDLENSYQPEIFHYIPSLPKRFRYKAKLVASQELGVDVFGPFGANVMLSHLKVKKFQLDDHGREKHLASYEFVITLLGGSGGVGISPASYVLASDDAEVDSPYDWDAQDFPGPVLFGELGGEAVNTVGLGMSEEGLIVFGNDPTIPYPLEFDFGNISIRAAKPGKGGIADEIDLKYGFSIDAGLTLMVGWLTDGLNQRNSVLTKVNDIQLETPLATRAPPVGFDFGSALLNGRGRELVGIVAARELYAFVQGRTKLFIGAHADLPDTSERNLELTSLRARNVLQAFKDALGTAFRIERGNVTVYARGDLDHLTTTGMIDTNEENPEFRRADIVIDGRYVTTLRGGGRATIEKK